MMVGVPLLGFRTRKSRGGWRRVRPQMDETQGSLVHAQLKGRVDDGANDEHS